jgi:CheY-like chemotaxis protein
VTTDPDIGTELVRVIPTVLWIGLIATVAVLLRRPIRDQLLPRLGGVKAFGVELTFLQESLDQAAAKAPVNVSVEDRSQVMRRAQRIRDVLQGARILWVDENPLNNLPERRSLQSMGIHVDVATDAEEAFALLSANGYDALISEMEHGGVEDWGRQFLAEIRKRQIHTWTVFYLLDFDPSRGIPGHAFGMTNRPDHLLHYIMDILERERI